MKTTIRLVAVLVAVSFFVIGSPVMADGVKAAIKGTLEPVKQPDTMACWAATATMMVSWKDSASYSIETVLDKAGPQYTPLLKSNTGLDPSKAGEFVKALGMKTEPLVCYTLEGFANLIKAHGPLWVIHNPSGDAAHFSLHALVATAVSGDGTAGGTNVTYVDPADGQEHTNTYTEFMAKYETAAADSITVQIAHY